MLKGDTMQIESLENDINLVNVRVVRRGRGNIKGFLLPNLKD